MEPDAVDGHPAFIDELLRPFPPLGPHLARLERRVEHLVPGQPLQHDVRGDVAHGLRDAQGGGPREPLLHLVRGRCCSQKRPLYYLHPTPRLPQPQHGAGARVAGEPARRHVRPRLRRLLPAGLLGKVRGVGLTPRNAPSPFPPPPPLTCSTRTARATRMAPSTTSPSATATSSSGAAQSASSRSLVASAHVSCASACRLAAAQGLHERIRGPVLHLLGHGLAERPRGRRCALPSPLVDWRPWRPPSASSSSCGVHRHFHGRRRGRPSGAPQRAGQHQHD